MLLALFTLPAGAQKVEKKKNSPEEKITVKRDYDEILSFVMIHLCASGRILHLCSLRDFYFLI
jgi:hypothetical protein